VENKLQIVLEMIIELIRFGNDPNIKHVFDLVDEIEKEAIKRNYIKDTKTDYVKIMEARKK
jgi:hypothetical protein